MNLPVIGAMINSALYLVAVFIAAFIMGKDLAWKLDVAACGITYLSYVMMAAGQVREKPAMMLANALVWLSIALGAAAGIALLF